MKEWKRDKGWSDLFIPEIKSILGVHLIGVASWEEDAKHNTDLVVLKMDGFRIGCRIRKEKYLRRWPNEFTIRTVRASGMKTELAKILDGWGDYFFYGFESKEGERLGAWLIGDLGIFRHWHRCQRLQGCSDPGLENGNKEPGGSKFRAFKVAEMPDGFIIARKPAAGSDLQADDRKKREEAARAFMRLGESSGQLPLFDSDGYGGRSDALG